MGDPSAAILRLLQHGYHEDDNFWMLRMGCILLLAMGIACCVLCPGELLIGVGVMQFCLALTIAVWGANPRTLVVGILGAALWMAVGHVKMERRRRQREEDEEVMGHAPYEDVPLATAPVMPPSKQTIDQDCEMVDYETDAAPTTKDVLNEALRPRQGPMSMLPPDNHCDCSETHGESEDDESVQEENTEEQNDGTQVIEQHPDGETEPDKSHDTSSV